MLAGKAAIVVLATRAALSITGLRGARRMSRLVARAVGAADAARTPWAVRAASRRVPGATCLTQALALQALLERAGRRCRVEIGVAKNESFEAHAWLVCGNDVLIGGAGTAKFQSVVSLD
jgi:hypothetical protein